ncbi:MAG: YqjD family protein [Alphaproteobacteria bacterium]
MADTAQRGKTEELSEQIEELRRELSTLSDMMSDIIDTAKGDAEGQVDDLVRKGKRAMRSAARKGKAAISGVETTISDNPWASVAVAFGLGIVLGRLLRR